MKRHIEILAPVGNREMLNAAIAAGAGAVYLASKDFGARAYADNFTNDELKEAIDFCHWNGVKAYITLNTMIKESEIKDCVKQAETLIEMGCDAIIIQDIGLINIIHKIYPTFHLHGSTQMSITSLEGALALKKLGLIRIVAGRECSIDEIERMVKYSGLEVEVFVHGSLCVSVSGQCYLSSFAGGRSGNRGRCAQPCRKEYDLLSGSKTIVRKNTILSPRDLCTVDKVQKLHEIGVSSIKIEGRMKKPEYVYAAIRAYDEAIAGEQISEDENLKNSMMLMTNRPFTNGFLFNDFGKNYGFIEENLSGINVGKIKKDEKGIYLNPLKNLNKGDIIRLKSKRHFFPITITDEVKQNERYSLKEYTDLIIDEPVYQIYTESVRSELKSTAYEKKYLIDLKIELKSGTKAKITAASDDVSVTVYGDEISEASNKPVSIESVEKSMLKLGNTPFEIGELNIDMNDNIFIAISQLNALRRDAVYALKEKIIKKLTPVYEKTHIESIIDKKLIGENITGKDLTTADIIDKDLIATSIADNDLTTANTIDKNVRSKNFNDKKANDENIDGNYANDENIDGNNGNDENVNFKDIDRKKTKESLKISIGIDTYGKYDDLKDVIVKISRVYVHEISQVIDFKESYSNSVKNSKKLGEVLCDKLEIYFVIPRLMEEKESSKLRNELLKVIENIDGFSVATSNELGFAMEFGKPIVAEYTWNFANKEAFKWASDKFERFMPSIELTYKELVKTINTAKSLEIPVYGKIQGMLLKYCPASIIKGCKDSSDCKTCNFNKNLYLKDSFGKREIIRRGNYSELYVPEILDLRDKYSEVLMMEPVAVRIYDRGEGDIFKVAEDWYNYINDYAADKNDTSFRNKMNIDKINRSKINRNKKISKKCFSGHFDSAIE